ncbi:glycosyl transferase family 1 [Leucothrix arctica]|uniref:Glycosyl transferase family 1 n=1 Tax=Leucothrix arctica TaxID=1481894 RepID=A0A317CQY2_9GAMM|nr:glycosyl transferase family 1 [Leucothrix arctica]
MNILHVVNSMDPVLGGVSKAVDTIATSLNSAVVNNDVVSSDDEEKDFISSSNLNIYALGKVNNSWSYNKLLVPWLLQNAHKYNYVIIHGLWLHNAYAVRKVLKKINNKAVRFFVMPHGMLDPYFQSAKDRRLKSIRNWVYWKLVQGRIVNEAHGVLFTCEEEMILARQSFSPYYPRAETVVGLGVESPPIYKESMGVSFFDACDFPKKRPYFLFLSRIHEKKGVDILLDAYENVVTNKFQDRLKVPMLVIAGPGIETNYGQSILERVNKSKLLKSNVFFPGMLSGESKWGAFYNCEAFVLPSHQENFGIANVEALACKKAILISNKINIHQEVNFSGAGFVSDDTVSGTESNLESWLALSNDEKIKKEDKAFLCFKEYFSIPSMISSWEGKVINKRF